MALDEKELDKRYKSKEDLISPLEQCGYCPFMDILRAEQRKAKVLYLSVPNNKDHPHRNMTEACCEKEIDEPCDMKYAVMRLPYGDFMVAQIASIATYKFDMYANQNTGLSKEDRTIITMEDAAKEWTEKRNELGNKSFADRFREMWDISKNKCDVHTLTKEGIYEITISSLEEYKESKKILKKINDQRTKRLKTIDDYFENKKADYNN